MISANPPIPDSLNAPTHSLISYLISQLFPLLYLPHTLLSFLCWFLTQAVPLLPRSCLPLFLNPSRIRAGHSYLAFMLSLSIQQYLRFCFTYLFLHFIYSIQTHRYIHFFIFHIPLFSCFPIFWCRHFKAKIIFVNNSFFREVLFFNIISFQFLYGLLWLLFLIIFHLHSIKSIAKLFVVRLLLHFFIILFDINRDSWYFISSLMHSQLIL